MTTKVPLSKGPDCIDDHLNDFHVPQIFEFLEKSFIHILKF